MTDRAVEVDRAYYDETGGDRLGECNNFNPTVNTYSRLGE